MIHKPGTPSSLPTKTLIFNWVKNIVTDSPLKLKVEDLGDGLAYCKIINHYFNGIITSNRIMAHPKTQYEYTTNLKLFQNALFQLKINIVFDVSKVAKQKFLQNWGLINSLYKHLVINNEDLSVTGNNNQDSKTHTLNSYKATPKRTYQFAFSDQIINEEPQSFYTGKGKNSMGQSRPFVSDSSIHVSSQNQNRQNGLQKPLYGQSYYQNQNQNNYENYSQNMHQIINQNMNQNMNQNINQSLNQNKINLQTFPTQNTRQNNSNIYSTSNQYISRPPLLNKDSLIQNNSQMDKCWSVGKIYKETNSLNESKYLNHNEGKYSVNSHIFQSNYNAVIDRVKQILLKASHDTQKIRQIKMLLNIPLNQEIVKVQQEQVPVQTQKMHAALSIPTKESIQLCQSNQRQKDQKVFHEKQQNLSNLQSNNVQNDSSRSYLNQEIKQVSCTQNQTSGKKIRNNWSQNRFTSFKK